MTETYPRIYEPKELTVADVIAELKGYKGDTPIVTNDQIYGTTAVERIKPVFLLVSSEGVTHATTDAQKAAERLLKDYNYPGAYPFQPFRIVNGLLID